jgi:hypothetical protein
MRMAPFHSANETNKPEDKRVHHNNNQCPSGQDIRQRDRKDGTAGYQVCRHCQDLNR